MRRPSKRQFDTVVIPRRSAEPAPVLAFPIPSSLPERHPLESLGEDMTPFNRAILIMERMGRHTQLVQSHYKVNLLDGKNATPGRFIDEANAVLAAEGLPAIDLCRR